MKFYGTMMCPDTVYADRVLRKNGIDIKYVDIIANMQGLKEFIRLRDERKEFDQAKESGKLGIPAFLLDDGSITFDVHELEGVESREENKENSNFQGCSIDGGC